MILRKRDLWNIKGYTSSAVMAKTYYLKQKRKSETGRHLTISPYGWDLYANTCQITLWSAVFYATGLSTFNIMLAFIAHYLCGGDGNEWRGRRLNMVFRFC